MHVHSVCELACRKNAGNSPSFASVMPAPAPASAALSSHDISMCTHKLAAALLSAEQVVDSLQRATHELQAGQEGSPLSKTDQSHAKPVMSSEGTATTFLKVSSRYSPPAAASAAGPVRQLTRVVGLFHECSAAREVGCSNQTSACLDNKRRRLAPRLLKPQRSLAALGSSQGSRQRALISRQNRGEAGSITTHAGARCLPAMGEPLPR
jgi:hypothetical protein